MAIKLNIELLPFRVPNYVLVKQKAGSRQDGPRLDEPKYHLRDLDVETLGVLCDEFRSGYSQRQEKKKGNNMLIMTPASHQNDPETSYAAEKRINKSGQRESQQKMVANLVKQYPNHTSAELAEITGLCRVMLARRLGEVAIRGESRKCAVNGTQAVTWNA